MKKISEAKIIKGTKVLVRFDFNVPVKNEKVVDDFRIRKSLTTLNYLRERKAKIIMISHIEATKTLKPVHDYLLTLGIENLFVKNYRNANKAIEENDIVLLENLRLNLGEKENDKDFAKELASLADIYVNDAFSVSHREHASVSAITKYIDSYAGLELEEEIKNLSAAFKPERPFLFVLGGAKFDTKLPLIEKFMETADHVFVGGALAHNFFLEQGYEIGKSVVSPEKFNLKKYFGNAKLLLPIDVVILRGDKKMNIDLGEVEKTDIIKDAGPKTLELLRKAVNNSSQILWNGPLGSYEEGFTEPTMELAKMISESKAKTIVGGGDTLAAIASLGIEEKFSFISSGGGAMLDYLANETLPGIKALMVQSSDETLQDERVEG